VRVEMPCVLFWVLGLGGLFISGLDGIRNFDSCASRKRHLCGDTFWTRYVAKGCCFASRCKYHVVGML